MSNASPIQVNHRPAALYSWCFGMFIGLLFAGGAFVFWRSSFSYPDYARVIVVAMGLGGPVLIGFVLSRIQYMRNGAQVVPIVFYAIGVSVALWMCTADDWVFTWMM